jgi:hypothetical protein
LPALLRRLHALPRFERAPFNTSCTYLLNKGRAPDEFLEKFQNSKVLPEAESKEFFARLEEIAAVYPFDDAEMVSSHNDLFKPDNILFDRERVWLVDWEAAFLNDRYADLVVVANQLVTNEADERVYLEQYFGAPPDPYQLARFHIMQQLSRLFYTMAFSYMGAMGKSVDWSGAVPDFSDWHRRLWAGEIDLTDNGVKIAYGRVHWERLLRNVGEQKYKEALRIVSDRPGARGLPAR